MLIAFRSSGTERKDRETKGRKEAHVPGWVRGGCEVDTADFLGINDKRLMMEVQGAKDLRFWKERRHALASTPSKEMKRVKLSNEH